MAKDKFADYDATAGNNTDIGGIAIQGTNIVSNFDNAFRELMSQIADNFASATVASSSTVDLGAQSAHYINITGTTTITAFGTIKAGTLKFVKFAAALILTHNATSLILPGAANITTAAGDTAVFVSEGSGNWRCLQYNRSTASSVDGGILAGLRNKIINGDFDIWQRGTSFASLGGYTADRWRQDAAGLSGTVTISRQAFTIGQTDVPGNPTYFLRIAGTSATHTGLNVNQKIEGVRTLAGQTATLTFWAKASAARDIRPRLNQNFGTGGSPSSSVETVGTTTSLTTSWQKFTQTVSVPSISGKTLGSNGDDLLQLIFDIEEGAFGSDLNSDSVDIAHVSFVEGDATNETDPFSPRGIQQELDFCQRYYSDKPTRLSGVSTSTTDVVGRFSILFPVQMREAPTVTVYDASDVANQVSIIGGSNYAATVGSITVHGIGAISRASGTAASTVFLISRYTADAEL